MILKRELVDPIKENLFNDYVLIIVGARQTGKTSLLLYLKEDLQDQNVSYISLEEPDFLSLLNTHPENLFDIVGRTKERQIVLIDEIQYLKDPSHFLKYHFDFHRDKLKLIVTGSSAFYLDQKFKDSLAGRKRIFFLKPLNLKEVLHFKGLKIPSLSINKENFIKYPLLYKKEIKSVLKEILIFGSYPAVVLEENIEEKKNILFDLIDSYTRKDILEAGIQAREDYFRFLKLLATQIGNLVNITEISSTLALSRYKIEKFIFAGLKSFHFARLTPFFKNIRKELTKTPKYYFFDCGFRNALLKNFQPLDLREDKGVLFENFVFNFLGDLFGYENLQFWRSKDKNEIDFIVEQRLAIEVKYSDRLIRPGRYQKFLTKYNFPLYFFIFERGHKQMPNDQFNFIYFS